MDALKHLRDRLEYYARPNASLDFEMENGTRPLLDYRIVDLYREKYEELRSKSALLRPPQAAIRQGAAVAE